MSYQRLLQDYAQTLGPKGSEEGGRRRLRWEKDEAMGNSKFRWTGTKVRYAHVVNRSLQMKLQKNVTVWARTHGSKCNEIEAKQREVWSAQIKRNSCIGSTYLEKQENTPKITAKLYTRGTNPSQIGTIGTPFSLASDFSIYRKPFEPVDKKGSKRQKLKVQHLTPSNSNLSSDFEKSFFRINRSRSGKISKQSFDDGKNILLVH